MNQAEKERLARVGRTFNAKKYIAEEIEAIRKQVVVRLRGAPAEGDRQAARLRVR